MVQFHSRALYKEPDPQPAVVAQAFSLSADTAGAEDRVSWGAQAKPEVQQDYPSQNTHKTSDKAAKTKEKV